MPKTRGNLPVASSEFLVLPRIWEAVDRTLVIEEAVKSTLPRVETTSYYAVVQYRGYYFPLDYDMVAIPNSGEAATAHRVNLLDPSDYYRVSVESFLKPEEECSSEKNIRSIQACPGVRGMQYPHIIKRIHTENMV